MPVNSTVAFIGLGAMGSPMAANLVRAGFAVTVHDVREPVRAAFVAAHPGARAAASPAEAARGADVLVTMLPTTDVVEAVLFGAQGVATLPHLPGLLLEMSSGQPQRTRALAARLEARGTAVLDAPVSGGVKRAADGSLAIMVGGLPDVLERARPLLQALGSSVTHVGGIGAGQALKALNNMCSAAGLLIAGEVLRTAQRFGLDPELVVDVLNASTGMNNATRLKLKPFVLSGTYASGFGLDLMVKDLGIACELAQDLGATMPFAQACRDLWREAGHTLGPGRDHTEIARLSARHAGVDEGPATPRG